MSKVSLELHDSRLASMAVGGHEAVLELDPACVHHWTQRAGRRIGAGWSRRVTISSCGGVDPDARSGQADGRYGRERRHRAE